MRLWQFMKKGLSLVKRKLKKYMCPNCGTYLNPAPIFYRAQIYQRYECPKCKRIYLHYNQYKPELWVWLVGDGTWQIIKIDEKEKVIFT